MRALRSLFCVLVLAGCSPNPYGFAPKYAPLEAEERAAAGAKEYDPVMVERQPDPWRTMAASAFGVVTARRPAKDGRIEVVVSVRRLEMRNLCGSQEDTSSCRVTVSDTPFGTLVASLALHPEDVAGATSLGVGSLVRLIGPVTARDEAASAPRMEATYYRHWPRGYFVTRANADTMRQ